MQVLLTVLALLGAFGGVYCQVSESTESPDYEQMEDVFTTSTTATSSQEVTCTGSRSGTPGSGMEMLMPVDLIEGCAEPEVVNSRALISRNAAFNQGICHSSCAERQVIDENLMQEFTGYPTWPLAYTSLFFSEDGSNGLNCLARSNPNNCQQPISCPSDFNPLLDCKRGCETRLRGVERACPQTCRSECVGECLDTFLPGLGCRVERFPDTCRAQCSTAQCEEGCDEGSSLAVALNFEVLQDLNGGSSPHPTQPPNVTHITITLYRVDVETVLPQTFGTLSMFANRLVGYCTIVIKVDSGCSEKFYVLDDTNEVDLGDFSCQRVNISYAIATAFAGVSNFSPPVTVAVMNEEDGAFPGQLTQNNVSISVEQDNRVGFFQQHIVDISWELPTGSELVTGYRLSLESFALLCGRITEEINDTAATSHTFQVSTPFRGDDTIPRTPPVTRCFYTLTVEVLPRNLFGADEPFSTEVDTGEYELPSSTDLGLSCDGSFSDIASQFIIRVTVELNSAFTPAIIEAIDFLRLDRFQVDAMGLPLIPFGNFLFDQRLVHINSTALQNAFLDMIQPPDEGEDFHEYTVGVAWRPDVPRFALLPSVFRTCLTRVPSLPGRPTTDATTDPEPTIEEPTCPDTAGSLYFELGGVRYESGSTILITEVGESTSATSILFPDSSLVCVTAEVNTKCCRGRDGGNVGEWWFPDGRIVPRNRNSGGGDYSRSGFHQQVRLNRRNNALGPSGVWMCTVPREDGCEGIEHVANISLVLPAPREVFSFCTISVWSPPPRPFDIFSGYDIRYSIPESGEEVMFSKSESEFFQLITEEVNSLGLQDLIIVQVRVRAESIQGPWTEPVPICS